jgi:N-acyl-D-aspartate/D-glutamate deacylase
MSIDLLIRGGTVVDGTGRPPVLADVAVEGDRIAAVGPPGTLDGATAGTVVDAAGRYVTPGFVDIHTHSDRSILINPRMESKLRQGVTTEVGGNCGSGVAPALGEAVANLRPEPGREHEPASWPTMAAYFEHIERAGIAGNYATWAAHGTLRASTVGYAMRPATADELAAMRRLLAESLEAGAFGLSTGLIYVPSGYADTDELVALSEVVRDYGGLYASHIRNEASGLLEAVGEAIEVGRRAGVPVQIAHHKASGRPNWGRVEQSLASMDDARRAGVDVACDQYPYTASSTGLSAVLPKWALEGGRERLVARLRAPATRRRIREEMAAARPDWGALDEESGWHHILIARCRGNPALEGRRLDEIAAERGQAPFDVCFDLLIQEDGYVGCVFFSMCEPDVRTVMRWPGTMIGSDASSVAPYGTLGDGKPHPRAYGTFARVLGHYVREAGLLSWPEAVHKMTAQPAARVGLRDRGEVRPGAFADLVVLDPATIAERATFADPHRYAAGVEHVFVNGVAVIRWGEHTGALPGRVLRRGT